MSWYPLQNPEMLDSPALLVYPDRVRANIRQALALQGDLNRLRPHVKTHKMRAVTDLMLAEGIQKFKCATIAEAEMLAQAGAPDVLLAYPVVGPKAARLLSLCQAYPSTRFSCLIDSEVAARQLAGVFIEKPLAVFIDLNVGMNRTGIAPAEAVALYQIGQLLPGLRVVGLHAYDGHIHDTDLSHRTARADAAYALAEEARRRIETLSGEVLTLVMGGTPTFPIHARRSEEIETSPGTFVFWDAGYQQTLPDLPFEVAAVLLTRVISIVDPTTLCLDLGHKAVAAENPLPRVVFPDHPEALPIGQSEEHLVVRVPDSGAYTVGAVWYAIPVHICPTVALYKEVSVVENGLITQTWPVTARDRSLFR